MHGWITLKKRVLCHTCSVLLLFLFLYVSWAVISLKYSASNHYDHYLLHLPLSPFNSLSLTNFHYYYYHDLYLLDLSLSTVMGHCICHAWQCTLVWGNSCTQGGPQGSSWKPTNQPTDQATEGPATASLPCQAAWCTWGCPRTTSQQRGRRGTPSALLALKTHTSIQCRSGLYGMHQRSALMTSTSTGIVPMLTTASLALYPC